MGCYIYNMSMPATWSLSLDNVTELSIVQCVEWCRGQNHSYAGLHNDSCHCSTDTPLPVDKVMESLCHIKCKGNDMQDCGGVDNTTSYISVYEVG